jgi:hypothetical protein
MSDYWFARRFPIGSPRAAMSPVHWKGWAVTSVWVTVLLAGGLLFAWLGASDRLMQGAATFIVTSFVATAWYLTVVRAKGDRVHTVSDYEKGKLRV